MQILILLLCVAAVCGAIVCSELCSCQCAMSSSGSGDEGDASKVAKISPSKDQVLAMYQEMARKQRAKLQLKKGKQKSRQPLVKSVAATADLSGVEEQLMLTVGRMTYCHKKGRGVADKSFGTRKVFVHREATYDRFLHRVKKATFGDGPEGATYFIADGSGVGISSGDTILVEDAAGNETKLRWTLDGYLKVSNIRYQSRAKFFCVQKTPAVDHSDEEEEKVSTEKKDQMNQAREKRGESTSVVVASEKNDVAGDAEVPQALHTHEEVIEIDGLICDENMDTESGSERNEGKEVLVDGFQPLFLKIKKSMYSSRYSFMSGLTQEAVLAYHLDDPDIMHEVQGDIIQNPRSAKVRPDNPCHLGFPLWGVNLGEGDNTMIQLVVDLNVDTGAVVLDTPHPGAQFSFWSAGFARDGVGVLACVALNGFHGTSQYQWMRNNVPLEDETYALIYTTTSGEYACKVTVGGATHEGGVFSVTGEHGIQRVKRVQLQPVHQQDQSCPKDIDELMKLCDQSEDGFQDVRLLGVIGQGNFGTVYKAFWRGTVVAAKVIPMPATTHDTAQREINMCRTMQHPNILTVMGAIVNHTSITLLTNLVRGCNLQTMIFSPEYERMSFVAKVRIAVQIAQAMIYLHTAKPPMVHLDIKPANILVEEGTMHAYLADFGLAKMLTSTGSVESKTGQSGTPGFQSPEQLKAQRVDGLCDVYSFGCVLIELFGEQQIWSGLSHFQIMYKVRVELQTPEYGHLPQKIRLICSSCLAPYEERITAVQVLKRLLDSSSQ